MQANHLLLLPNSLACCVSTFDSLFHLMSSRKHAPLFSGDDEWLESSEETERIERFELCPI